MNDSQPSLFSHVPAAAEQYPTPAADIDFRPTFSSPNRPRTTRESTDGELRR